MRLPITAVLLSVAASTAPAATDVTRAVVKAVEARDCAGAVKALNAAMATDSAEAWLLGGSMYEQGLCLKPNVERAARLYTRAVEAGRAEARSRLAGLYALPAAGPDKGAALWWALQAELPLPLPCQPPVEARGDADRFAAELGAWTAVRLEACVYVAGVLANLDAEFVLGADKQAPDSVSIDFQPAAGRVDVALGYIGQEGQQSRSVYMTTGNGTSITHARDPSPEQMRELQLQAGRRALAEQVDKVATDALRCYPRPAGIDAGWRIRLRAEAPRPY
jgi:hypothetical protein